ncbi:Conserved_hypothetical protein [Hexamita inflata]|uniref:Uncharacterized protein n=1 Tax=Hexamita inflata TaxID=28002 RepID=A0AA86NP90_9EUKA|nr:Conserved hypothetical protein [Hexamita inflata]
MLTLTKRNLIETPVIQESVKQINLQNNQLTQVDISPYPQVVSANISFNPLTEFVSNGYLTSLIASSTLVQKLVNVDSLQQLSLQNCNIHSFEILPNLPNIMYLDLSQNKIQTLLGFKTFTKLINLNLSQNAFKVSALDLRKALMALCSSLLLVSNEHVKESPDPLLAASLLFPGKAVRKMDKRLTEGQKIEAYLVSKQLVKIQQVPLNCSELILIVSNDLEVYQTQETKMNVTDFQILGEMIVGQTVQIKVQTNYPEFILKLYSIGKCRTLISQNQTTYQIQYADAGNYLQAELETPQQIFKATSTRIRIVPNSYFSPKFVYWKNNKSVILPNGTIGVLYKQHQLLQQVEFLWQIGSQEVDRGQFTEITKFMSGKTLKVNLVAHFQLRECSYFEDIGGLEIEIPEFEGDDDFEFVDFGQLIEGEDADANLGLNRRKSNTWYCIEDLHQLVNYYDTYKAFYEDLQQSFNYNIQGKEILAKHYTRGITFKMKLLSTAERFTLTKYHTNTILCCVYDNRTLQYSAKLVRSQQPHVSKNSILLIENEIICDFEYVGGYMGKSTFTYMINEEIVLKSNMAHLKISDLVTQYFTKLQGEKYDELVSETFNIKLRQALMAELSLCVLIKPARLDGIIGIENTSEAVELGLYIQETSLNREWNDYEQINEIKQKIQDTQLIIEKCDFTCEDVSDYQIVVDLQTLMQDVKSNQQSFLFKLNSNLIQKLCNREKISIFDQLLMQGCEYQNVFGSSEFITPEGQLSYMGTLNINFKDLDNLKLQSQFGIIAVRQSAIDRQLTAFEQQLLQLVGKLIDQPPELLNILSTQHSYQFSKLDVGCQILMYFVQDTFKITQDTIQIIQLKNKVHFHSNFPIQRLFITPFNYMNQQLTLMVEATQLDFLVIKWYVADQKLHPNSTQWSEIEQQMLQFTPTQGNFVKCLVAVPDKEQDLIYSIIILIPLGEIEQQPILDDLYREIDLSVSAPKRLLKNAVGYKKQTDIEDTSVEYRGKLFENANVKFSAHVDTHIVSAKLYRVCNSFFQFVSMLDYFEINDEYVMKYTTSLFDTGCELIAQIESESGILQVHSVTQRQHVQMSPKLKLQYLEMTMNQKLRARVQYGQRMCEFTVNEQFICIQQAGSEIFKQPILGFYSQKGFGKTILITNNQLNIFLEFEDELTSWAATQLINSINNMNHYDIEGFDIQPDPSDQYICSLVSIPNHPGDELYPFVQDNLYMVESSIFEVSRVFFGSQKVKTQNLFQDVEELVVSQGPYVLQVFDCGYLLCVKSNGYNAPINIIKPAQLQSLIYQMDKMSTFTATFQSSPITCVIEQAPHQLERLKCVRGQETLFTLELQHVSVKYTEGLKLELEAEGREVVFEFNDEEELQGAYQRLCWGSGHCKLRHIE